MSNEEETQAVNIPAVAMDPILMLGMTDEEITAKTVSCSTCPVFLLCESSSLGSGVRCGVCGSTGVFLREDDENEGLILDCNQHKFPVKDGGLLPSCPMCTGQMMRFEYRELPPKNWIIRTVHSAVSLADRRKVMGDSLVHWKKYYAEETEREAREKEKSNKAKGKTASKK